MNINSNELQASIDMGIKSHVALESDTYITKSTKKAIDNTKIRNSHKLFGFTTTPDTIQKKAINNSINDTVE